MDNNFTDVMAKMTINDLMKVIKYKDDYLPEAVEAAEKEIKKRKELFDSGNIPKDKEDDFEFEILTKFKQSSDDELINYYKNEFKKFSKIEIDFLTEELAKRNIEPKVWYYVKGNQKNGPLTPSELKVAAKKGEIDHYDYIWREGMKNWFEANRVDGLFDKKTSPPPISGQKPIWINQEQKNEKPIGIIIAAIVMFLTVPMWLIIALAQAGVSFIDNDSKIGFISLLNILSSIATISIGVGILQLKKWGYIWGVWLSFLNIIWFGYIYLKTEIMFFLFLLLLELIICFLLLSNREAFNKKVEKEETVFI